MVRRLQLLIAFLIAAFALKAQAPAGYYNGAANKTGEELRAALHAIITNNDSHVSYDGIWTAYQTTDARPNGKVWDIYSSYQYTFGNNQCGSYDSEGDCYNREHLWAQSWTNNDGTEQTDLHHVFPTDGYVNNRRGNYAFGEVETASWTSTNGGKLGTCSVSGYSGTVFEPIDEYKGDIARALMYVSVRYYGLDNSWGTSGMTNKSDINDWAIAMLLQWHHDDPVSDKETARNNAVYSIQHNRNPFVDNPDYAYMIWDPTWLGGYQIIASANPAVGGAVSVMYDFNENASIDFSTQGYSDATAISSETLDANVGITFDKGTSNNAPKYYTSGTAIRCYGGNYFTVSTALGSITDIVLTYGSGDGSNTITADVGSFSNNTWTGNATSVTFTIGGTSGNRRLKGISVTYSDSDGPAQQVTAPAGATATLSATPDTGYTFVNWTKDNAVVSTNPTYSFTVNAEGIYVANFELETYQIATIANPTYGGIAYIGEIPQSSVTKSIDFSAQGYGNGTVISSATVDDNINVAFNKGSNSNAPTYYTSGTAIRCYGGNYFTVSSTSGPITKIELTYGSSDGSNAITTNVGTFSSPKWTGSASSVKFTIGGTSGNRRIQAISVTYSTGGGTPITVTTFNYGETASLTATPNAGFSFVNWTKNDVVVSTNASYSFTVTGAGNYVANFAYSADAAISENTTLPSLYLNPNVRLTINSGVTLAVTGAITEASGAKIVIEDGGQLINNTPNVNAIVEKDITKWVESSRYGWHAISTPVRNVTFANVTNLTSTAYNVYRLNETNLLWENSQDGSNVYSRMQNGHGYLYRKGDNAAIEFNGTLNVDTVHYALSYTSSSTKGFHLIGNPYPHNIYKGVNAAIPNTYLEEGFYTLTLAGGWIAGNDHSTPITPCQGVVVQAKNTVANNHLVITKTAATGAKRDYDNNIMFTVSNSNYEDVAYAVMKEGHGLNKIEHRNDEIPMLYIHHNGEDFAIANIGDDVTAFNLNFRAATMGRYTMNVKTDGDFSYLHLIDAVTGEDVDMLIDEEYSFIGAPSDKENRFIVKLDYNTSVSSTGSESFAYQNGNDLVVSGEGELQIFDVTGRLVMKQSVNGVGSVSTSSLQTGVYILRLIGADVKTQKIVVK